MIKIMYHAHCPDGFTAAWVAWNKLKTQPVEFIPVTYGDAVPQVAPDDDVYILDFSFPNDQLRLLKDSVASLMVIDHHKTAVLDGVAHIYDVSKSGARLTYEYFYPDTPIPRIITYTEDRDLWNWALVDSQEINAFISTKPQNFDSWDHICFMLENQFSTCRGQGAAVLAYRNQLIERIVSNKRKATYGDLSVLLVNSSAIESDIGERLKEEADFIAIWYMKENGNVKYSLRAKSLDVGAIAKSLGGGGHKLASGFELTPDQRCPFELEQLPAATATDGV